MEDQRTHSHSKLHFSMTTRHAHKRNLLFTLSSLINYWMESKSMVTCWEWHHSPLSIKWPPHFWCRPVKQRFGVALVSSSTPKFVKKKEFSICDCHYINPDQGPLSDEWRRQTERLFGETTNEEKMAKIEALRSKLAQSNPQLLVDLPGPDNGDMFLLR